MPDGSQGATGNVLVMSAEDDPEDTIRPRLEIAGAKLDRIHFLDDVITGAGTRGIQIPDDLSEIEDAPNPGLTRPGRPTPSSR